MGHFCVLVNQVVMVHSSVDQIVIGHLSVDQIVMGLLLVDQIVMSCFWNKICQIESWCRGFSPNLVLKYHLHRDYAAELSFPRTST